MTEYFRVGVITTTHGIHGEVKVFPTTDDVRRFSDLKRVFLERPGFADQRVEKEVESVKFFKNLAIVKFKGWDAIEDVQKLHNVEILVAREDAVPLEEGEYYIADLIGCRVFLEDGSAYGVLEDVMQTAANDVYVVRKADGSEVLVPGIPQCLIERKPEEGRIVMRLMPGLDEAYDAAQAGRPAKDSGAAVEKAGEDKAADPSDGL